MRVDVHQHLWSEGLLSALAARPRAPRVVRDDGAWALELAGEPRFGLGAGAEDPSARAADLAEQGVDLAVVAQSAALGVETLPPDDARAVIAAWDDDADAFPAALPAWGAVALAEAAPADVDALLDRGRIGLCLPATALGTPDDLERTGPLLERLAQRGAPLFVHPGPATSGTWLPALTAYVDGLSRAWLAWATHGRRAHPDLRVVFAALAGLAPLHAERLAARGHPDAARSALADRRTYLETSSYGPTALGAVIGAVGPEVLVHGSDLPYADPVLPPAALQSVVMEANAAALIGHRLGTPAR